jgi:hypothetical protein
VSAQRFRYSSNMGSDQKSGASSRGTGIDSSPK